MFKQSSAFETPRSAASDDLKSSDDRASSSYKSDEDAANPHAAPNLRSGFSAARSSPFGVEEYADTVIVGQQHFCWIIHDRGQ